mgnify:CR=1 FL=1
MSITVQKWNNYFREGKDFSPVNDLFLEDLFSFLRNVGMEDIRYVLDLGCGTGNFAIKLAKRGLLVKAIDYSIEALKIAKEKARNNNVESLINFELVDIEKIKFLKEKYDLVILRLVYAFIKNKKSLLSKIKKVLSEKGWLFLETPVIFKHHKYSQSYQNIAVDFKSSINLFKKNFRNVILFNKQYSQENGLLLSFLLSDYKIYKLKDTLIKTIIRFSDYYINELLKR